MSGIQELGSESFKKQMQKEVSIYMSECYNDNCSFSTSESKKDIDDMQYFTYIFVNVFHSISDLFAMLASCSSE